MKTLKIFNSEYAKFRPEIINYFIKLKLFGNNILMDPMAGSSPLIPLVEKHGGVAYFNDILPVFFYINSAKQYKISICFRKYGRNWFMDALKKYMKKLDNKKLIISEKWIREDILDDLINSWKLTEQFEDNIQIFLKAVIIKSIRYFATYTKTQNPTWLKMGGANTSKDLNEVLGECLDTFENYYDYYYSEKVKGGKCFFTICDAENLNFNQKVNIIITSPPYCNRLDGIRLFAPENYFLSMVGHKIINSNNFLGTIKVIDYKDFQLDFDFLINNSRYCKKILISIKNFPNKDDVFYYLKYYTRYFIKLYRTLKKILENLELNGKAYIILQDNTHRGIDIEIDRVLKDLLQIDSWKLKIKKIWERHHLGLRNPSQKSAYIKRKQLEKILLLEK